MVKWFFCWWLRHVGPCHRSYKTGRTFERALKNLWGTSLEQDRLTFPLSPGGLAHESTSQNAERNVWAAGLVIGGPTAPHHRRERHNCTRALWQSFGEPREELGHRPAMKRAAGPQEAAPLQHLWQLRAPSLFLPRYV